MKFLSSEKVKAKIKKQKYTQKRKICEECGIYPADLPDKICVGCQAYKEHQR